MQSKSEVTLQSKFKPGQKVSVRDTDSGQWRDAIVEKPAPYHRGKCDGAYVYFDPYPKTDPVTGITPSCGGWKSEHMIRERGAQ